MGKSIIKLIITLAIFYIYFLGLSLPSSALTHGNTTTETASLSVTSSIDLEIVPTTNGTVGLGFTNVLVKTDSKNGYQLLMAGRDGIVAEANRTALYHNGNTSSPNRISSVIGQDVNLSTNTWGYSLDSSLSSYVGEQYAHGELDSFTFSEITSTAKTIKTITRPDNTNGDITPIYIGVKAIKGIETGNYNNSLIFTTIVEPNYKDNGLLTIKDSTGTNNITSADIGDTITLVTDYSNAITPVTVANNNLHVYIFTGNEYSNTTSITECTNITINSTNNGTSITKPLTLTCTIPLNSTIFTNGSTYGIYLSLLDQSSGKYFSYWLSNSLTIYHIYRYNVTYDANDGTNAPSAQSGKAKLNENVTITIPSTVPTQANYIFLGWATSANATTADPAYAPGSTVTLSSANPELTLHAVWAAMMVNGAYMQDMTAEACRNAATWDPNNSAATTYTLVDNRVLNGVAATNNGGRYSYLVRKLSDGNCWMVQNLAVTGGTTLKPADSDVTSDYALPTSSQSADNGRWSSNTDLIGYMFNGTHQDGQLDSSFTGTNSGGYYSYVVATAGLTPTTDAGHAPNSICPKSWKLPTGGAVNNSQTPPQGQFQNLYDSWANAGIKFETNSQRGAAWGNSDGSGVFQFTSSYTNSACPHQITYSMWWSSTIYSTTKAYYIYMHTSGISPQKNTDKSRGTPVRCILTSS